LNECGNLDLDVAMVRLLPNENSALAQVARLPLVGLGKRQFARRPAPLV
jgi:hypothetical protein